MASDISVIAGIDAAIHLSGGHFNPAATVGLAITDRAERRRTSVNPNRQFAVVMTRSCPIFPTPLHTKETPHMTDALTGDALHAQPVPVDLGSIETTHPDPETPEHLLSTTVAETAAGVTGVHHLGGKASRALDRASRRIRGTSTIPGVTVSRADGGTIIDLDLVVEYPHTITEVLETVRIQVTRAAAQLVSEPVDVNVNVTGVHGPFDKVEPVNEEIDPSDSLAARASAAADTVKTKASEAASTAAGAVTSATDATSDALAGAKDATAEAVSRATEAASTATDAASDAVSSATDTVKARAADTVAAAADVVSDAADTVAEQTDSATVADDTATDMSAAADADADQHENPVIVVVPVILEATAEPSEHHS
ncbi:hypothetical protein B7R21_03020 [Subtercola boreus]|uniref:Asp23/Gls24 family envelope stress response protein n=1 Tax=Subtercola boreus TaxID=120213 RepID=A0A3E0W2Y8_9MICO|nr:hypothetical protein B7R21_03020 [Subtercola boreus]